MRGQRAASYATPGQKKALALQVPFLIVVDNRSFLKRASGKLLKALRPLPILRVCQHGKDAAISVF
ncbi:MAG: hypothetical protein DRH90_26045 [Deltaproteobacteria bacterium]|nr:MAG: hypothetical protein DRH90_26045 [Deltaproteobacteria bacterium]